MRKIFHVVAWLCASTLARAEPILPTAEGTTWKYEMTQEFGEGIKLNDASIKPEADGKVHLPVVIFAAGPEKIDNAEAHKFERHGQGAVQITEFLQVKEDGIFGVARMAGDGEKTILTPPQKTLSLPLKAGEKWEYHSQGTGIQINESYQIVAQESVQIPAGKFEAYHIHLIETKPFHAVVDRWFVPNIGYIKDVTEMKRPSGALLQRISLELTELPKIANRPEVGPADPRKKLSVGLATEPMGKSATTFSSDTAQIYARWQGHDLRGHAKVRAVWIAENVSEVAPPDYKVDEASTIADSPNSFGTFTLSRPDEGWVPGDYRVEFYVDETLAETVKLKIDR
jgi:hypothetical protein